jgi:sorting nexin-29
LIRNGLNEGCLERYLLTWINAENISEFYESHALLRDEKAEILPKMASDINSILFAIKLDVPELNVSSTKTLVMVEPVIEIATKSSISKPKKVNQIDNFEETKTLKKDVEIVLASKFNEIEISQISSPPKPSTPLDTISISTESSSHSNFYDAKDDEDDDTISHSSSSSEEGEEAINEPLKNEINEKIKHDTENRIELEATIQNQNDRIKELEQQILDLTVENTRLRQLLNANKVNTAANFQVSIPRAILRKSKTKTNYYVYEINLRSTNGIESWTIFKRYRDFYKLHKDLKKQHVQIKILDFPPKKKIGNMAFDIVEDRRQRLQVYIRHVLQTLPDLQVETKALLETKCPFFKT